MKWGRWGFFFVILAFLFSCGGTSETFNTSNSSFISGIGVGIPTGGNDFYGKNGGVIWVELENYVLNKTDEIDYYRTAVKDYNETAFEILQRNISKAKFFSYWVTKDWSPEWIDLNLLQEAMNRGIVPVFFFWYFGDSLNQMPSSNEIEAYFQKVSELKSFLLKLKGKKLVVVEPEFNEGVVEDNQDYFASLFSRVISELKAVPDTYCGLVLTDTGSRSGSYEKCGYEDCSLGDKYEWSRFDTLIDKLQSKLDFLGFQEMLSQFSRNPDNPDEIVTYTEESLGIDNLRKRIENFADFLYEKWNKPVMLGYFTIATGTWNDTNGNGIIDAGEYNPQGWNEVAQKGYEEVFKDKQELLRHHLFMLGLMEIFDNPHHDLGGYQFFLNNEYHLGIAISPTVDGSFDSHIDGNISFKVNPSVIFQ